jgi:hypothetical protein
MKKLLLTSIAALFLATGAAHAGSKAATFYLASCLEYDTPKEDGDDCTTLSTDQGLKACELLRKHLLEYDLLVGRCAKTEEQAKKTVIKELSKRK